MGKICLPNRNRTAATAALLCSAFAWPALVSAQTWTNPGTGNWFDPVNWSTAAVPITGGTVIVSNGGTATVNGLPASPVLGSLNIGLAGTGTGAGTVTSNGAAVNSGTVLNIGTSTSAGADANGLLQIGGGAGGAAGNLAVGTTSSLVTATVVGRLDAAGSFVVNGGNLVAGQTFGAARSSVANGVVNIGGNAGMVNFLVVGDVFSFNNDQVGSRATGAVTIGGNMALTGFASVGTAFPPDRVADVSAPGGFRFNQSSGTASIAGTLSTTSTTTSLLIGATAGGVADGALSAGVLDTSAGAVRLQVGNSSARGQAAGRLTAASGDLRTNLQVDIGTAVAGTAQGSVTLGSRLLGNDSGLLRVGTVINPSGTVPGTSAYQGSGSVTATGGISGFTGYDIAAVTGPQAPGSRADGSVIGGSGAPTSNVTRFVSVGIVQDTGNAASANGSLILGNSLKLLDRDLIAGQVFSAGPGSVASGVVNIAGNAGMVRSLLVGESTSNSPDQAGSRATGTVEIGGNMALTRFLLAGYTSADRFPSPDRVADTTAPGGFRVNQASGTIKVGGTLSITNPFSSLFIGSTAGGIVDGSVRVGSIAVAGNTLQVDVGVSGARGQATGTLEINGGALRADTVRLGVTTGGSASGRLALTNANLEANTVRAGTGGGTAMLLLSNAQAAVAQDMALMNGLLGLERSRLRVGNNFTFGNDALMHVEIDGLTRGTQYGTIDALAAMLDGHIEFDFGDFLFSGASAVFDILRSGGTNGITDDFDAFSFLNLAPNYTATAGIELDAGVEVYRVRLARINAVPEPASALLLLLGLGVLAGARQRKRDSSITFRGNALCFPAKAKQSLQGVCSQRVESHRRLK